MELHDWTSLGPQLAVATDLYESDGMSRLAAWLKMQLARIEDSAFAKLFSDHINLAGIVQRDYNHRLVERAGHHVLGGIRFYGQDVERPFVDVIAHDLADWDALRTLVANEWEAFAPKHLRVIMAPNATLPPGAHVDMSIHAARYRNMTPSDGRLELRSFQDVEEAVALMTRRYADVARVAPALAGNVSPSDPNDIRNWHLQDQLLAIRAKVDGAGTDVGLLAIAPGAVEWIKGDEIHEEVVATIHAGRGYAASAQAAWASQNDVDPDRVLVGTIDRLNVASRRSAIRAGRHSVLDYAFVPLM